MNRNELIEALASRTTLSGIKAALKAADAYAGHSRDKLADLRKHAVSVASAMVTADQAAKPPTTEEPSYITASKARTIRPNTRAKFAQVVLNGTTQDDGSVVCDSEAFTKAGMGGKCWIATANKLWTTEGTMQHRLTSGIGYTARSTKGTVVFTQIPAEAKAAVNS